MPTNCKGQDKPGQSRGYRAARDKDRGARGSPGRRGRESGRGLGCCPHPALPSPAEPGVPPVSQHRAAALAGHPCSSQDQFVASYVCTEVTSGGSRMAATSLCRGDHRSCSQAGFGLCGRAAAKPAWACKCGSLAHPPCATPTSPQGNRSHPPPLLQAMGSCCQHYVMVPELSGEDNPGALEAREPWAACTAGLVTLPTAAESLNGFVKGVHVGCFGPQGPQQASGRAAGLRFPLGYPKTRTAGLLPFGHTERGKPAAGARRGAKPRLRSPCQDVLATFPNTDTPAATSELAGGLALPSLSGPQLPLR